MKLFRRKKKKDDGLNFLLMELRNFNMMCKARIGNGDMDLDDWVFRGRDHSEELLEILDRLYGRVK